jgi:hypothetical protein
MQKMVAEDFRTLFEQLDLNQLAELLVQIMRQRSMVSDLTSTNSSFLSWKSSRTSASHQMGSRPIIRR